jgi:hypothetical protein
MDTSGAKVWLPGISDTATLDAASVLLLLSAAAGALIVVIPGRGPRR